MKAIIVIIVLVIAGLVIYNQATQPPNETKIRAKAQESSYRCVTYFLDNMLADKDANMLAVCEETKQDQARSALNALHKNEREMNGKSDAYSCMGMGSAGAYKCIFTSKTAGVILSLTIVAKKDDNGIFFIMSISQD